jgi:hypothetical protein
LLAMVTALAGCANTPPSDTEIPGLIATCNIAADSSTHEGRALRACDTLAKHGLLSLAEPDAALAYSRYQQNLRRWQACQSRQAIAEGGEGWQDPPTGSVCLGH